MYVINIYVLTKFIIYKSFLIKVNYQNLIYNRPFRACVLAVYGVSSTYARTGR